MIDGFVDLLALSAGYSDLARHVFPFDFEFVDDFCFSKKKRSRKIPVGSSAGWPASTTSGIHQEHLEFGSASSDRQHT